MNGLSYLFFHQAKIRYFFSNEQKKYCQALIAQRFFLQAVGLPRQAFYPVPVHGFFKYAGRGPEAGLQWSAFRQAVRVIYLERMHEQSGAFPEQLLQ